MNCNESHDVMSAYLDNELDHTSMMRMQEHLSTCSECRAELEAFQRIGSLIAGAELPFVNNSKNWDAIEARLAEGENARFQSSSSKVVLRKPIASRQSLTLSVIATAASIIIAFGYFFPSNPHDSHQHAHVAGAVDYSKLYESFSTDPMDAFEGFANQYAVTEKSKSKLDFVPAVTKRLPDGYHLVSTRALNMPYCTCKDGTCKCGPNQCNCSVSYCKRADGSPLLVIEHCKSQQVNFGDEQHRIADAPQGEKVVFGQSENKVATWTGKKNRFTVLGVANDREVDSLYSSLTGASL